MHHRFTIVIFTVATLCASGCGDGAGGEETYSQAQSGQLERDRGESEPFESFEVDAQTQEAAEIFEAEPQPVDSNDPYRYSKFGPYATTTTNYPNGRGYLVYHPRQLDEVDGPMPIVTWANPTAFDSWVFYKLLHLVASHGFVVVASHDLNTGSGDESIGGIDLMLSENDEPNSRFYRRLDTERIGAFGHSQGAMGTINAVQNDPRITASVPLHPGGGLLNRSAKEQEFGPMLIFTGQYDIFAMPNTVERSVYEPQQGTAVFAVRKGVSHYGPVSILGGDSAVEHFTTAWFLLFLRDRRDLEVEFFGANCRLCADRKFIVKSK